jgi:hypothetical protein
MDVLDHIIENSQQTLAMTDDARERVKESLARNEKRVLAWVYERRPQLQGKALTDVITSLREESYARSEAARSRQTQLLTEILNPTAPVHLKAEWSPD